MNQPLSGVRIVDLTQVLAGPFATRLLGDLGAEVIKIEQPGTGDPTRSWGPYWIEGYSAYFLGMNRNKKSLTLNLRHPKGKEAFFRLVAVSDVVADNYRVASLRRLGLEYEKLREVNPRIIQCSLSGYGDVPGYEDKPAFDSVVQAMGGAMSVTGEPGRAPLAMGFPMGDLGGGMLLIQGVLAALFARERTGEGQRVELSLLDAQILLQGHLGQYYLASGQCPGPIGNSHPHNVPVGAFLCQDDRYIQVHAPTQGAYEAVARAVAGELGGEFNALLAEERFTNIEIRRQHKEEVYDLLRRAFRQRTVKEWVARLDAAGAPCAPINTIAEALDEPPVRARNMVVEIPHPEKGTYRAAGNPLKFAGVEERFVRAPKLGEHTDELLQELGYAPEEIARMREEGVV